MTKKRSLYVMITMAVSAILALVVYHSASSTSGLPHRMTPLTATYTITRFSAGDALPINTETRGFAVAGNGSSVELFYRPDPAFPVKFVAIRVVTDISAKQRIHIVPFGQSKSTYPLTDEQANREVRQPATECSGQSAGTLLGYEVLRVSEVTVGTDKLGESFDKIETIQWRAPALNCLSLRTETTFYKGGNVRQREIQSYVTLREGEPDSSLFEIPKDYTERLPSETMALSERLYPNDKAFRCGACDLTRIDEPYLKAQTRVTQ